MLRAKLRYHKPYWLAGFLTRMTSVNILYTKYKVITGILPMSIYCNSPTNYLISGNIFIFLPFLHKWFNFFSCTSGFWPRVRARALSALVFLSSLTGIRGPCSPPPPPSLFSSQATFSQICVPITEKAGAGSHVASPVSYCRKLNLCILKKGIALPRSQFLHSCVCERFIYSQDQSTYLVAAK